MAYYRDNNLLKKVGNHIRDLRKRNNLSQEELAFEAELDITQIGRIERGKVNTSICVLNRIAKALNVPLYELLKV